MSAEPLKETPPIFLAVVKVAADVAVDALPVKAAVIVPAAKLPEPSRFTIVEAVLLLVAASTTSV